MHTIYTCKGTILGFVGIRGQESSPSEKAVQD